MSFFCVGYTYIGRTLASIHLHTLSCMCGVAALGTELLRLVNHVTDGTGEPVTMQETSALWPSVPVTVSCTAMAIGITVHGKDSTLTHYLLNAA